MIRLLLMVLLNVLRTKYPYRRLGSQNKTNKPSDEFAIFASIADLLPSRG
jgi:hypothetical protein